MNAHHDWRRDTRRPTVALPARTCDCAIHVFDPARADLLLPGRRYEPPVAWLDELRTLHNRLGVQRAVQVQPSVYGSDHTVLLTALRSDPARYRGVALLDDSVSDAACEELHAAGVRSARFNILSRFGAAFDAGGRPPGLPESGRPRWRGIPLPARGHHTRQLVGQGLARGPSVRTALRRCRGADPQGGRPQSLAHAVGDRLAAPAARRGVPRVVDAPALIAALDAGTLAKVVRGEPGAAVVNLIR